MRKRGSQTAARMVLGLLLSADLAMAQTAQFPVNRDVGINGFPGEEFTNMGASASVRGAKFNQHAALFDWDTEPINAFLAENPGKFTVTFSIFPLGFPDTDVTVQTVESQNDWEEGNGNVGCCGQFGWTEDTPAATNGYAQTYYLPGPVLDDVNSLPWLADEDGSPYRFMDLWVQPNFINSTSFELANWEAGTFITVQLDEELFDDLINNPDNRGLRLAAPQSASNWEVSMLEKDGGTEAAFLEVTVEPQPEPRFARGDSNADRELNLADPIFFLSYLLLGGPAPGCLDGADADDSGVLDITDAVYNLSWQFLGGPALPAPSPGSCGPDPTTDNLSCASYPPCR